MLVVIADDLQMTAICSRLHLFGVDLYRHSAFLTRFDGFRSFDSEVAVLAIYTVYNTAIISLLFAIKLSSSGPWKPACGVCVLNKSGSIRIWVSA